MQIILYTYVCVIKILDLLNQHSLELNEKKAIEFLLGTIQDILRIHSSFLLDLILHLVIQVSMTISLVINK